MTENEYWAKISDCEYSINICEQEIRDMKRKIGELEDMESRFQTLLRRVEEAASAGKSKIGNLASMLMTAGKKIRDSFWEINGQVYTGAEYQKSCNSIEEAIRCIRAKVNELENNISDKYRQIGSFNYQITEYRAVIATLQIEKEV